MPRINRSRLPQVQVAADYDPPAPPQLAVTVAEALRLTGVGRTTFAEAIEAGEVHAVVAGPKVLVLVDSLRDYLVRLPRARYAEAA